MSSVTTNMRIGIGVVGVLVLGVAVALLFLPMSIPAGLDSVGCGSAVAPSPVDTAVDNFRVGLRSVAVGTETVDYSALCADRIQTRQLVGVVVALLGVSGMVFSAVTLSGRRGPEVAAP
jgi:hypothetical protein